MSSLKKMFCMSVVGLGMIAIMGGAYATDATTGRAAYNNVTGGSARQNRAGAMTSMSSQRMPTMPTLPNFTVGNTSPSLPPDVVGPEKPDPEPEDPDPVVDPECPDGGVKDSEYTVDNCMDDLLLCINTGALQGGLNDLFNEDLRNSIVNGMGLCLTQVERCIAEVRRDCKNIYRTAADVWIDFNSRRVQPEYYNFVLRKTGLTPNQAENTCLLLDVNTYGSSFDAVSNSGRVTAEYNIGVGAYNNQAGNVLVKRNPQGVELNYGNSGVDGQRGHYARWDPTTAECWVRVGAYNKDSQIKNSWLFGAVGNDQPAEVWRQTGDTFTCNRDLFGFSLMNQTNTTAVVGIGGGALVGAGVGAIAGHGARAFDCTRENHREMLTEALRANMGIGTISAYIKHPVSSSVDVMNQTQCQEIVNLYDKYKQINTALLKCDTSRIYASYETSETFVLQICEGYDSYEECVKDVDDLADCRGKGFTSVEDCIEYLVKEQIVELAEDTTGAQNSSGALQDDGLNPLCTFMPLKSDSASIYCDPSSSNDCVRAGNMATDIERLDDVFTVELADLLEKGEESNMGKSIGIGAGVGAGAGGLATAITAFVERSNINCRVGDGLAKVDYGKSYSIGSLKDFYVKWKLNLPDTVMPTGTAVDCETWRRSCGTIHDLNQCKNAQINYKPADAATVTLVPTACTVSGSVCIENYPVAKSYGACE